MKGFTNIFGVPLNRHLEFMDFQNSQTWCTSPSYCILCYSPNISAVQTSITYSQSTGWKDIFSCEKLKRFCKLHCHTTTEGGGSFDVVSFFTNVSTGLAIKVARKYLEGDESLEERTLLTVDNIILLLDMCLSANYLQFLQECYQ